MLTDRLSESSETNGELTHLKQDLDRVESVMAALDAGERAEAEALVSELARRTEISSPHPARASGISAKSSEGS